MPNYEPTNEQDYLVNCRKCKTGRHWWFGKYPDYKCTGCDGNPYIPESGHDDWEKRGRAKAVAMFGPRLEGDVELLEEYRGKIEPFIQTLEANCKR